MKRALIERLEPRTRAALRIATCHAAEESLRKAQLALRANGCDQAARAVAKARKSVQGAIRHAHRLGAEHDDHTLMAAAAIAYRDTHPAGAACPECERSNGPHYRGPCPH